MYRASIHCFARGATAAKHAWETVVGEVTAEVAAERTAACCAAGTVATAEVGHPATSEKEHNPDLGSVGQEACRLDPCLATYPAVDQGLVGDGASG